MPELTGNPEPCDSSVFATHAVTDPEQLAPISDAITIWDTPGASIAARNIGYILESLGASKSVAMNQAFKLVEEFIRDNQLAKQRLLG